MGLWKRIAGTVLPSFGIGNGSAGNKSLYAETGAADPPAIRWNDTDSIWEFSLDGTTWQEFVSRPGHKALRQLIHFVETNSPGDGFGAGPYVADLTYAGQKPASEIWYTSAARTHKICQWSATYNPNQTPATETWTVYKEDGSSPAATAADSISYTGILPTTRTRALTVY